MLDILLAEDGDLRIGESGDIALTNSIRQAVKIRLRWFFQEWRLGPSNGLPYYEEVFVKNPNELRIVQLVRDEIKTVDGVTDVRDVSIKIDRKERTAAVRYELVVSEETYREEVLI